MPGFGRMIRSDQIDGYILPVNICEFHGEHGIFDWQSKALKIDNHAFED